MTRKLTYYLSVFVLIFLSALTLAISAEEKATLHHQGQSQNQKLRPISDYESGRILSLLGSNTLGAKLVPEWVKLYLSELGLQNIHQTEGPIENETIISAYDNKKLLSIKISAHGSSTGFKGLNAGTADIAMSSRPIKVKEQLQLATLGSMKSMQAENIAAIDGLAIIVHKSNRISSLTVNDISEIFSGEIQNWSELGGGNIPIHTYARDKNSGTWDTFRKLVLGKATLAKSTERFESNDHLSDLVSNDPSGIGFVGLASVRESKALSIADGYTLPLEPSRLHVATEDYPLARRLYLYTAENQRNPRVLDFLQFIQSESAQFVVDSVGFVSLNPIQTPITEDLEGPSEYMEIIQHADRLSINFRFQHRSAELDNRSKRDIERLANYIRQPDNTNKRIQLIGFGDLDQDEKRAGILSRLRASVVKSALHSANIPTESVLGFGAYMPIASNLGRNRIKNQRVEVWLFDEKQKDTISQLKRSASRDRRQKDRAKIGFIQ
ncbi:MAG: phosphate transport system substrate-binding protein [Flavobacteriales bacterium]|jgi:phosphate transport system substrate-binding protein